MKRILIYGAGGFAREVAWLVQDCARATGEYLVVGFLDDNQQHHGKILNGAPVLGLEAAREQFADAYVVGGVGSPKLRQELMGKAERAGFPFATVMHPRVERSEWIEVGVGTVICAGNILTTNIVLGRHVQMHIDCTIGHDVVMGDFATLAPGVHVSGYVRMGQRVYVGTGAVIINGTQEERLVIAEDAVIGAGACVTRNVAAGDTVVGVPAKPIPRP